jgi:hypothetical protein
MRPRWPEAGEQVYLNLPLKPAIQIDRRVASAGVEGDNHPIMVEQTLCLVDGRWWNGADSRTPHTEYRLLVAILHRASDNRHALIARNDPEDADSDLEQVEQQEWILFEPEIPQAELKNEAAQSLIDGDDTNGYSAVLALYDSQEVTE